MKEGIFKQDDLMLCDWQYTIRHTKLKCFEVGEIVFLGCNPEFPMTVHSINNKKNNITTIWYNSNNEIQYYSFPPECILQYRYAGLLTYKGKFCVSLN